MISLLFSNWRFVLDAILIIALVVLLFVINPFGIFGNGLQLSTTTNMVTEVQQIGQLVTAEYYGEVISSLNESRLALIEESEAEQAASNLYSELKYALYDLYQYQQIPRNDRKTEYLETNDRERGWRNIVLRDVSRKNIVEKVDYLSQPNSIRTDSLYNLVIEFLWREKYQNSEQEDWNPNIKEEARVLLNLYNELSIQAKNDSSQAFHDFLDDGFEFAASFQDFTYDQEVSELSRAEQKKQLTMVGRGWVKAGFDFGQFDESTFYLHEETGELHFFGLEPQILDADINPWFIPERAVPGFEILDYRGALSFKDAQKVKRHCIQKLTLYAHQANIIEQAQKQGAETLKSFFSLITGREIHKVHFHNDHLTQSVQQIMDDEFINYYEGILIDSLTQQEARRADSLRNTSTNRTKNEQLANELDSLRKQALKRVRNLPFENTNRNFNFYSTLVYRIGLDSIIDQHEQAILKQVRWDMLLSKDENHDKLKPIKNPQYWYEDSLELMMEYNMALKYLEQNTRWVTDTTFEYIQNSEESFDAWVDSSKIIIDYWALGDSIAINYFNTTNEDSTFLHQLRYPFYYNRDSLRKYLLKNTIFQSYTTTQPDTIISFPTSQSAFYIYDSCNTLLTIINLSPFLFIDSLILRQDDTLSFGSHTALLTTSIASANHPSSISDDQLNELQAYYHFICDRYNEQQNKGPIVRASEWVRENFALQSEATSPINQIKKILSIRE